MPLHSLVLAMLPPLTHTTNVHDERLMRAATSAYSPAMAAESAVVATVPDDPPINAPAVAPVNPAEHVAVGEGRPMGDTPGQEIPPVSTSVTPVMADSPTTDDGDIMVTARRAIPGDPAQAINIVAFNATQAVDRAVIAPVATVFERVVPSPVRSGMRNFLNNLHEPTNAINFLLQHKIGKFCETVVRFVINSTVGIGGLVDVARRRPFNLPRRRNSFANTFGFYGIGPGPFLYLPLVGATSVRDLIGGGLDSLAGPAAAGAPFNRPYYAIPTGVLREIDNRVEFDATVTRIRDHTDDPYTAARTEYLTRRHGEIELLRCGRLDCAAPADGTVATPVALPSPAPSTAMPLPAPTATTVNAPLPIDTPPPRR